MSVSVSPAGSVARSLIQLPLHTACEATLTQAEEKLPIKLTADANGSVKFGNYMMVVNGFNLAFTREIRFTHWMV